MILIVSISKSTYKPYHILLNAERGIKSVFSTWCLNPHNELPPPPPMLIVLLWGNLYNYGSICYSGRIFYETHLS